MQASRIRLHVKHEYSHFVVHVESKRFKRTGAKALKERVQTLYN